MFLPFYYFTLFYKGLSIKNIHKVCLLCVVLSINRENESLLSMGGNISEAPVINSWQRRIVLIVVAHCTCL